MEKARILIVEDEGIVARDIHQMLERYDYNVIGIVSDGVGGIEKAGEAFPDLVLMDIKLKGGIDGVEAAQLIQDRFGVPVVYLTAYADEDTLGRAKVTESYGYLVKPVEERALNATIEMAIYKSGMERELKESEERFRNLVETTSDLVWQVDEKIVYTYVSPKISDMLGYYPEDVLGRTPFDFMPPDEVPRVREIFDSIVSSPKPFSMLESSNLHKNGHRVILETSGVPFFDRHGRFCGLRGINRDITERKRIENMKDTLLRDISHELKHPVAIAKMEIEVLRRKLGERQDLNEYLEAIEKNMERLQVGVHKVLDFSYYDVTQEAFKMSPLSFQGILDEIWEEFGDAFRTKGIEMAIHAVPRLPEVQGNSDQILRLLQNIVENALKFTPDGQKIEVNAEPREGLLEVTVHDTGRGISQEDLSMVFERFFKGHGSVPGVGLGLTICKDIVDIHGGNIWIQSEGVGKGTAVTFTLPFASRS